MSRRNRLSKSTERYLRRTASPQWKTGLYARLSSENNDLEDGRSLQNQIRISEEYIKKHPDLNLTDRYIDNGRSGMNFDRTEFKRMMEDIRKCKINCIVVKDLSRFGRNHIEAGFYLEKIFPKLDVRFISVNDNYDSMAEGSTDGIMVPLKNIINEMYAADTSRKVLTTLKRKEDKGERAFWAVPYGYKANPECSFRLIPDPETADFVRLIFKLKADGVETTEIARRLNNSGVPAPLEYMQKKGKYKNIAQSRGWNYRSVRNILKNRTYTGSSVYNTQGKGEYKIIPGTHEALVDSEIFEALSREMENRGHKKAEALKKGTERSEKYPDILKGLFFCGCCGHSMLYDRTGNSKVLRSFKYRCSAYGKYRKNSSDVPPCSRKIISIPEQRVYKFILDSIRQQLKAAFELEALSLPCKEESREAKALKSQEAELKIKKQRLYENFAENIITEEEFRDIQKIYNEKINNIRDQLKAAESADNISEWTELKNRLFSKRIRGEGLGRSNLTTTSYVEILEKDKPDITERLIRKGLKREVLEAMIERIELNPDGSLKIKFKYDFVKELKKGE
ncbi:MAG: recombinase family protein [Eubacterium sp.]|nr:recombinase family protein [Eubacterium sp.]